MIHGQYAVKFRVHTRSPEAVGGVWAEYVDLVFAGFVDGGDYLILLLGADEAVFAVVGVEGKHGDTWMRAGEIGCQRAVEGLDMLKHLLASHLFGYFRDGSVDGDQCHAHAFGAEDHHGAVGAIAE